LVACGADEPLTTVDGDLPNQPTTDASASSDQTNATDTGEPVPNADAGAPVFDDAMIVGADSTLQIDSATYPYSDLSAPNAPDSSIILPGEYDCLYAGYSRKPGDQFPSIDGCNTCSCTKSGDIVCTEKACPCMPSQEWYQHYEMTDPMQCAASTFACAPNTLRFDNSCGCGCRQSDQCPKWFNCMPPTPCDVPKIKEACPYSGIAY
jgi:hypothetical protein